MDKKVRVIEIKESVFNENKIEADELRLKLKQKNTFLINVMASPGAGKTTTLIAIINKLKKKYKIGVMEADIDSLVDSETIIEKTGCDAIQIHTGGMCHLDAAMTNEGLNGFSSLDYDIIFLENVGNLVCPAEFDTGSHLNMNILSVPEGDDKPLKYPLMFQVCDIVLINKIDVKPYFNFDSNKVYENIKFRNKNADILEISSLNNTGIDDVISLLEKKLLEWREKDA